MIKSRDFGVAPKPDFWIAQSAPNEPRVHIAFRADTRSVVDAFYRAAIAAGGRDNGAPGIRPHYHDNYYGAFVLDPDGHNIEAVCHFACVRYSAFVRAVSSYPSIPLFQDSHHNAIQLRTQYFDRLILRCCTFAGVGAELARQANQVRDVRSRGQLDRRPRPHHCRQAQRPPGPARDRREQAGSWRYRRHRRGGESPHRMATRWSLLSTARWRSRRFCRKSLTTCNGTWRR